MTRIYSIIICLLLATTCLCQTTQNEFALSPPDSLTKLKKISLWATQYYVPQFKASGKIPILNEKGKKLGLYLDTCDFCQAALEGTAYISDSAGNISVINYEKKGDTCLVNCRLCPKYTKSGAGVDAWGKALWTMSKGYGYGVINYKLVPYRSIAVDSAVIPYGTVIYVPAIKGLSVELPNKAKVKHDGYLFASDAGGAIKNEHIDVFTGICTHNPFPKVVTSDKDIKFDAYIVTDKRIISSLRKLSGK